MPQLPDPVHQRRMRISFDVEVAPAIERPHGARVCQQPVEYVSAQYLGDLYVYQVRGVDSFRFVGEAGRDSTARGRIEQKLDRR